MDLAKALLASQKKYTTEHVPGRLTDMKCDCGGPLREFRAFVRSNAQPPYHRKKRIRKKWRKEWEQSQRYTHALSNLMSLMRKPYFRCESCESHHGFYQAVGRNIFQVEPFSLPPHFLYKAE